MSNQQKVPKQPKNILSVLLDPKRREHRPHENRPFYASLNS